MADTSNLSNYLKDLADAIREKKGTEGEIPAANFDTEIKSIETGIDTSDATATANDIVNGKTAYINGEKVTGTIKALTSANHTLLTPTALEDEDNEVRLRLETTNRRYTLSGTPTSVYVKQDALADVIGLTSDKLVEGTSVLGVEGTAGAGGIDTSDATATVKDILAGKTAYVDGEKLEGTMANNGELNYNSSTEEQTIPAGYTSGGTIAPAPITQAEYDECLVLTYQILGTEPPAEGHIYGVKRLRSSTATTWERTDEGIGLTANATHDGTEVQNDFDNLSPWKDIISFNYDSAQQLATAYYGDDDFTFSPSDIKVNVFTKIPRFWYKRYIDEDDYEHIQIADYAAEGFLESKEFAIARYSYEGSTSNPRSCSGLTPLTSASGQSFQSGAKSLGDNMCLFDWRALGTIQILYLVEYANNNSQEMLGKGITGGNKSTSGQLNSLGMKSGCLNNNSTHSVIYRGIEDIFGNVYQLIDGVNINNYQAYVCTDHTKYEFQKYDEDYVKVGYINNSSSGYISQLGYDENYPLLMLPIKCSGVSYTTGFTDYYSQNTGERAVRFRRLL